MKRNLTEQQQKFLDVLFDEAEGDPVVAKKLAGYSENTPTRAITEALADEIYDLTKKYIATNASKAAHTMISVMSNPVGLGIKDKTMAAKDILDRAGLKGTDRVEVTTTNPMFILPPKEDG